MFIMPDQNIPIVQGGRAFQKLAHNEPASCLSVKMTSSPMIARLAYYAGVDALYVDLEHGCIDLSACAQICLTAYDLGLTPLVRIPREGHELISRVLDNGAMGVIIPHVDSAQDARRAVKAARFPSDGQRGSINRLPHLGYQHIPASVLHKALNDQTLVIAMIESSAGLDHVQEIASVPGIDLLWIGMNDLSADLGLPGNYAAPAIIEAARRVAIAAQCYAKHWGIAGLSSHRDLLASYAAQGASFFSLGSDAILFDNAVRRSVHDFDAIVGKEGM